MKRKCPMAPSFKPDDRVVRGPNWKWGDQDGNGPGTVVPCDGGADFGDYGEGYVWVNVRWDSGDRNCYRVGPNVCDLKPALYGNEED